MHNRLDASRVRGAALELDCLRARPHQIPRSRHCLFGCVVSANREINHQKCAFHCTRHRAGVVQHFRQRDISGVFITEHHHADRIAHQDDVDPTLIE